MMKTCGLPGKVFSLRRMIEGAADGTGKKRSRIMEAGRPDKQKTHVKVPFSLAFNGANPLFAP